MSGKYQSHVTSGAATFSSPSMSAGDFGILVQISPSSGAHGTPTWNAVNMTLALNQASDGNSGVCSIWYTQAPPVGVTTIARGANVSVCYAVRATEVVLSGSPIRSSASNAQTLDVGDIQATVTSVGTHDLTISGVRCHEESGIVVHASGEQTGRDATTVGADGYAFGTSQQGAGGASVIHHWDFTGNHAGVIAAVAFIGTSSKSSITMMI